MLYFETGVMEIRHVVAVRRLCQIKKCKTYKMVNNKKKVYEAQRNDPSKGDWIKMIQADMEKYESNLSDEAIKNVDEHE